MKVQILFYHGTSWQSRLIQWRTYSEFSHVAIRIEGILYEAKTREGVVESVARKEPPKSLVDTVEIDVPRDVLSRGVSWLIKQVGKKYDWWSILLFAGLPNKKRDDNTWYCSELAYEFLRRIGKVGKVNTHVSPGALYLLIKK